MGIIQMIVYLVYGVYYLFYGIIYGATCLVFLAIVISPILLLIFIVAGGKEDSKKGRKS